MDRNEYLAQLRARLTGRMGEEELKNALSYYEEYFEDAGPEREQEVIGELGSPAVVAAQVLGEQERSYTPPVRRRSHAGVIALCIGLGVLLVAGVALIVFSFAGYQTATILSQGVAQTAAPSAWVTPTIQEDGEQGYVDALGLEAFSKVTVEASISDIILEEGTEYALTMDWYLNSADLKYKNENGTLKIWDARTGGGKNQQGGTIRITVPEGAVLDWADLKTGLGDVTVRACAVSNGLTGYTGLGSVDVSGSIEGEIDLESGMGDIAAKLDASAEDYQMDLEAGMGTVKVDGEKYGDDYETNEGRHELDCSTGMGDITVSFGG